MKKILALFLLFFQTFVLAQTKVSGVVLDDKNKPISYSTVAFKNSAEGVMTDENGKFYLESKKNYSILAISNVGYTSKEITLNGEHNYDLKILLSADKEIEAVTIYSGKTSKKKQSSY